MWRPYPSRLAPSRDGFADPLHNIVIEVVGFSVDNQVRDTFNRTWKFNLAGFLDQEFSSFDFKVPCGFSTLMLTLEAAEPLSTEAGALGRLIVRTLRASNQKTS